MTDKSWQEDLAELEHDRDTVHNLETVCPPARVVPQETAHSIDQITRRLMERSRYFDGTDDENREMAEELLKRALSLRKTISPLSDEDYDREFQEWAAANAGVARPAS